MAEDLFEVEQAAVDEGKAPTPPSLLLRVHLQPGAGASGVTGRHGNALGVRVAPPPASPRATEAARRFLAELLSVEEGAIELVGGEHGPAKRFRITGVEAEAFDRQLDEAIEQATHGRGGARGGRSGR